jgi:hypothetical protein
MAVVQFDWAGNSDPDGEVSTDQAGYFTYRPDFGSYGAKTVHARVKQWSAAYQHYLIGPWQQLALEWSPEQPVAVTNLQRVAPESNTTPGASQLVTLSGNSGPLLKIEYDTTGDNTPEGSSFSDEEGGFQFNVPGLAAGERTVRVSAARYDSLSSQYVMAVGYWRLTCRRLCCRASAICIW